MLKIFRKKVVLSFVMFLLLGVVGYVLGLAYMQKQMLFRVNQVIERIMHDNPSIKDVHYQSATYTFIPFWHDKLVIKGLLVALNRNIANPFIINTLTVTDFHHLHHPGRLSFWLGVNGAHFKHFKYSLGIVNESALMASASGHLKSFKPTQKVAAPSLNADIHYDGRTGKLVAQMVMQNYDTPFLHFNFKLRALHLSANQFSLKALLTPLSAAKVMSITGDFNIDSTIDPAALNVISPELMVLMNGLGYHHLPYNIAGYTSYTEQTNHFQSSINLQLANAGKLGVSLIGLPGGLYFKRLFGQAGMLQNPFLMVQHLKTQTLKQFYVSGMSLTYEDDSLLSRLLRYFSKKNVMDLNSYKKMIKSKLQAMAAMTEVQQIHMLLTKASQFIGEPGRLQLVLKPHKPFLLEQVPDFLQKRAKEHDQLQTTLIGQTHHKQLALIQAYEHDQAKQLKAFFKQIGFNSQYVSFDNANIT